MFFRDFGEEKYHRLFYEAVGLNEPIEIVEVIGKGSYGFAYLARNTKTNERFVLKRMRRKHVRKQKLTQKFDQEIAFLQMNLHANIPAIREAGQIAGIPYYTMDYIEGKTFEQLIFEEGITLSIEDSLRILSQVLEIVCCFHAKGIVHRDLRIPNILKRNNDIIIIDFGLACYEDPKLDIRTVKNPKKAPSYASDLYYLGHFLLFLLYSNYSPNSKKERSWQEELQLPIEVHNFLEKLLLLQEPFESAQDAALHLHNLLEIKSFNELRGE